jgi:homogentisate 1,2-dioxygenase
MKNWIQIPKAEGLVSRQAHADFPPHSFERELGKEGFFGPATHMYHQKNPMSWTDWEGPLRPRAFNLNKLGQTSESPFDAPEILTNSFMRLQFWELTKNMDFLARNADGDILLFIHEGMGSLFCDYGHMAFRDGDYIMIPRSTLWRMDVNIPIKALIIEATNDSFRLPEKGIVGPQAIFDPGILDCPQIDKAFKEQQHTQREWIIHIKRRGQISKVTFPHSPLDAIGWKGNLHPVRINWRDIRPLMSHRYHLPPSAHTTFVANRFVVCTFCPRPIESDPGALKVPFFHNNDDYDEILFYHAGNFFSRDNIGPGMMTLHPCGFTHGPHPKALKTGTQFARKETDEVAVMIDTRDPVDFSKNLDKVEDPNYVNSWKQT